MSLPAGKEEGKKTHTHKTSGQQVIKVTDSSFDAHCRRFLHNSSILYLKYKINILNNVFLLKMCFSLSQASCSGKMRAELQRQVLLPVER